MKTTNLGKVSQIKPPGSIISVLAVVMLVFCCSSTVTAKTLELRDYQNQFESFDKILLYRPNLIKDIFHGMIDTKGNSRTAFYRINKDVLGCSASSYGNQVCRIDELKLKREKETIKSVFEIPLNFSSVSAKRFNKKNKILTLKWKPGVITPPDKKIDDFLLYLNAARDSRYYKIKKGAYRIQLNTIFEREASIILENRLANNLMDLYQQPKNDKKDSFVFAFDFIASDTRNITIDYFIYFKIVRVKINHQYFSVTTPRSK